MTQVVTVRTDFADLNQMAQGLIGRVNETHVILPAGTPIDVGEWAQFAVTLLDGTPGLAGMGRCVTYVDNGEERQAHQRFDVVFDSLQFDPRGQQIYTHILTLSGYEEGVEGDESDERNTMDDVGDDEVAAAASDDDDASDEIAFSEAPAASTNGVSHAATYVDSVEAEHDDDADETAEATVIAQRADMQAAIAATMQPSVANQDIADDFDDHDSAFPSEATPVASRAGIAAVHAEAHFEPAVAYTAEAVDESSFRYANGLPFPAVPPRPPLSASQKVAPAPGPNRAAQ